MVVVVVVPVTYILKERFIKILYDFRRIFQYDMHIFADDTLPDLPQRLKTFFLLREIFAALANQVSAQIADAAVASRNALASVYDHFDIVCVEDDIVFELELVVEVRYEEIYSAAAFASVNNCEGSHNTYKFFTHYEKQRHWNVKHCYLQLPLWLWHLLRLLSLVQPWSVLRWRRLRWWRYAGKNIHGIRHLTE